MFSCVFMCFHLALGKKLHEAHFKELQQNTDEIVQQKTRKKRKALKQKLNRLKNPFFKNGIQQNRHAWTAQETQSWRKSFVINKSGEQFNEAEMSLLNKGLKYKPRPKSSQIDEIVTAVETAIQFLPQKEKGSVRHQCEKLLKSTNLQINKHNKLEWRTLLALKEKNCVFTKADKSNEVVIMKKETYDDNVTKMLTDGPYEEVKFKRKIAVDKLQIDLKDELQKLVYRSILTTRERDSLIVQNPIFPRLYGLPKTHKEGEKMRPIVSNVKAPTSNIAKVLTLTASKLKQPIGFSIKNSFELIERLKNVTLGPDEELCSFDVEALFPSVPTSEAINEISSWITDQDVSDKEAIKFVELSKICLNQSFVQWRDKTYKQTSGLSMGNGLSPFAANIFMSKLEREASKEEWFPRFWSRYVDDVIAIIKKGEATKINDKLNDLFPSIKFTHEVEKKWKTGIPRLVDNQQSGFHRLRCL